MSSPRVDPKTFQCHAAALTTRSTLLCIFSISYGTYFPNMFISVYICLYTCICVCMCAWTVYIPKQEVYGQHRSLCGLGARPCGQRCWSLAAHNWYMLYEQIWARYVDVERYRQIQTDLHAFKRPKMVPFLGKWSIWRLNTCISGAYLVYICVYHVYICLYVYIVPS